MDLEFKQYGLRAQRLEDEDEDEEEQKPKKEKEEKEPKSKLEEKFLETRDDPCFSARSARNRRARFARS